MPIALLPDPTDYGNPPGEGPLRPGGMASDLPVSNTANLPSTLSPRSQQQQHGLAIVRDLWGGTERVRERSTLYLPQAPGEDGRNYRARLERSVFFNAFRRTVEGLTGLVFRADPVLSEDVPPKMQEHWENIDNAGTHGDVFLRQTLEDALCAGHAAILVEFPQTGGVQTARDENFGNEIRPYWVPIAKDNILSWRTTNEYGRTILKQLVVKECSYVPDGLFGEVEQIRYRVFARDAGIVGFVLLAITKDNRVIQVDQGLYPTQDEIPVAEVTTSGRVSIFESTPPLLDLAYLNIAHYQQQSDYFYAIHKTNVPFIFGAGIDAPTGSDGQPVGELVIGPNTSVLQSNPSASMQYVAHDGAALGSTRQALEDLKNDMGTLGLAMLAPQKRAAETAEAKRLDKATSDSALSVTARGLQDACERALGFHAKYMGLDTGGSVVINRDYDGNLMEPGVMSAYASLGRELGLPPRVIIKALKAGGRIPDDEDVDALELEMMAAMAADEQRRQEAREAFAQRVA